ncbi:NAD(P)/FAD-dependent oxidoreductase [Romboutsia sp.]|uniref:NAD(P)/FAD-dependent oxidoreductase n=1 Tax=Romboutsia sp. TaxID=1965302 RepID=UPI003F39AFC7
MKYSVVIIGAGPAGMAAAHSLINNNISCCVIDKQTFPRNKLCAGGITGKAMDLINSLNLGKEFNGKNTVVSTKASLYVEYEHLADVKTEESTHLVDRFEFDEYLVNTYKEKGGKIIEGIKVNYISTKQKHLMLSNNEIIDYDYIIGADGAVGLTHSIVNKNFKTNGFCLQVDINKKEIDYDSNKMSLYYGIVPYGYGWIFPKEDCLTVGLGANYSKDIDFKKEFEVFLNNLGIKCERKDFKGAIIPFGEYLNYPINKEKNIVLVGDAAGFADPITGEGIYFAVLSGMKAANVITNALLNNDRELIEDYIDEIKPIINNIKKANRIKNNLYKYRRVAFTPFKNEKVANVIFNKYMYNSNYEIRISNFFKN